MLRFKNNTAIRVKYLQEWYHYNQLIRALSNAGKKNISFEKPKMDVGNSKKILLY